MPTPAELVQGGILEKIDVELDVDELPQRSLYAYPDVVAWLSDDLPKLVTDGYVPGALKPLEQALTLFHTYIVGKTITQMPPHTMQPEQPGVWELRTHDLRFFGWFWLKGVFIISAADQAAKCKADKLYGQYRKQAVQRRNALDLTPPPKFITGVVTDVL